MRSELLEKSSGKYQTGERAVEYIDNGAARSMTLLAAQSGTLFAVDMSTVDNNVTVTLPTSGL